jgi:hypothetical protein
LNTARDRGLRPSPLTTAAKDHLRHHLTPVIQCAQAQTRIEMANTQPPVARRPSALANFEPGPGHHGNDIAHDTDEVPLHESVLTRATSLASFTDSAVASCPESNDVELEQEHDLGNPNRDVDIPVLRRR